METARRVARTAWLGIMVALCLVMLSAGRVEAILGGETDGSRHPFGACIVSRQPDGGLTKCSSGALASASVVIMAGHSAVSRNAFSSEHFVTFDPTVDPAASEFIPVTLVPHPAFETGGPDIGVAILEHPATHITPVRLPTAGYLAGLQGTGALAHRTFTVVGYGCGGDGVEVQPGPVPLAACNDESVPVERRWASTFSLGLDAGWLGLQTTSAATGSGSPCGGDSGGPVLLDDSLLQVALIVTGSTLRCTGVAWAVRLDTVPVRSFLGDFIDVP